jgi:aspartate kinase
MLVFKFGGASVKDAAGIVNLGKVVENYKDNQLLIVVSAMGKTTNALEKLTKAYFNQTEDVHDIYEEIKQYHYNILSEIFDSKAAIFDEVANTFVEIDWMLEDEPQDDYDFIYDQIVSVGELVSTRIVNAYLKKIGLKSQWLDVRGYIHTDNTYREGVVLWAKTKESIVKDIPTLLEKSIVVTQGFLGGTSENFTTTLGREGSDYTASILASCLGAESVTTYYGASVIHPKTIKPLQNAKIPLLVKPFNDPTAPGTVIKENGHDHYAKPIIILKQNQVLLSLSAKDYAFISETHLSEIFSLFAQCHVKINMMQTSALSFTACFDEDEERLKKLLQAVSENFKAKYNSNLSLLTTRHYTAESLKKLTEAKVILLEQISRNTAQMVVR